MGCLINPEVVIRGQEEGMERPSLVGHGVLRLPPGFRFHPTDEELVVQYLKRKAFSCPLPAFIIPEIDLRKYNPWDLPGGMNEERYFFSLREGRYANGNQSNRATGSGYWKATGKDKMVVGNLHKQVVGMKKVLVFYQGKPQKGMKTDWIMHEYRLELTHSNKVPMREWVLCRIFMKKRVAKRDDHRPPSPLLSSASESSCVTEIFDGLNNEEETSSSP